MDADDLISLGFAPVGRWIRGATPEAIALVPDGADADEAGRLLDGVSALYAFVRGREVLYVGKTSRTLRARLAGYCAPPRGQRTNWRCNGRIRECLGLGQEIAVLGFRSPDLSWRGFAIDVAAGLENSLIRALSPPWNVHRAGAALPETAAREIAAEAPGGPPSPSEAPPAARPAAASPVLGRFDVVLGATYYGKGWINPPAALAGLLGGHGEPMAVWLGDLPVPVESLIYREPGKPRAVRLMQGMDAAAAWFRRNFKPGDVVRAEILGPGTIRLLSPGAPPA